MDTRGEVTEAEWRAKDRRRALLVYGLGAAAAVIVTVLLYIF
jgi:hypothetical protein